LKQNRGFLFGARERREDARRRCDPASIPDLGPRPAFARKRFGHMASLSAPASFEPGRNCQLCPRLAQFRAQARAKEPDWHNAPVASFGDASAQLLIVGLAPGMQGANRTGRPFTGDYAGDLLYATLLEYGFAKGVYQAR